MKNNRFTEKEFRNIGDNINNMDIIFLGKINQFRIDIDTGMNILHNGATLGEHTSILHPNGKALDYTYSKPVDLGKHIATATKCGLNGIGIYRNERGIWSFHLDDREKVSIWYGIKTKPKQKNWEWTTLVKLIEHRKI